jgi:hypothetical protein
MNSDMIIEDEDEVTVGTEERIFDIERMIESPEWEWRKREKMCT